LKEFPEAEYILEELAKTGVAHVPGTKGLADSLAKLHITTAPLDMDTEGVCFYCKPILGEFILPTKQSMQLVYSYALKKFKQGKQKVYSQRFSVLSKNDGAESQDYDE
jgi:hypothetical protein